MNIGANRNAHGKRTASAKQPQVQRLDSWASRLWRGIELVFKSLHCFTVRPIFSTRPITRMKSFSFFGGGGGVGWGGGGGGWWGWGVGGGGGGGWGGRVGRGGGGGGVLSSNAFTIWSCIPISMLPRVIRRFKRRSC